MKELPVDIYDITPNSGIIKRIAGLRGDALTHDLLKYGDYEPHFYDIVKQIINEGDIAVDMGANLGYHTVTLARLVGNSGRVLSFEPQRIVFQQLNCNVFLNKLDNVMTFWAAVGETQSVVYVEPVDYHKVAESGGAINAGDTCIRSAPVGESVTCVSLDSFNLPKVKFIKLDIQGSELNALKGAKQTIDTHRPFLFVEIEEAQLNKFCMTSANLIDYIKKLNYRMLRVHNSHGCDHICIPRESNIDIKISSPFLAEI